LNHLPPDITSGQGLNGFQQLFSFYNTFYITRDRGKRHFHIRQNKNGSTCEVTILQKFKDVLAIQNTIANENLAE
jgi:hypothetical protein